MPTNIPSTPVTAQAPAIAPPAVNHLNGFSVMDAYRNPNYAAQVAPFVQGAQAQAANLINSPLVQGTKSISAAISQNVAAPLAGAVTKSVNPIVNTALNPGSTLLKPALQGIGVPAGIAGVAGAIGDFASPGGKVGEATKFEKSVVQIVNQLTGDKAFLRVPAGQLSTFHNLIDDTAKGIAGKPNQYGDIYHLTAKTPEQMAAEGFNDLGVAHPDIIPRMVGEHQRGGSGVNSYMRFK